jgi:hypothetical protein
VTLTKRQAARRLRVHEVHLAACCVVLGIKPIIGRRVITVDAVHHDGVRRMRRMQWMLTYRLRDVELIERFRKEVRRGKTSEA